MIFRSYLGRNILVDMYPMVELHTILVIYRYRSQNQTATMFVFTDQINADEKVNSSIGICVSKRT